MMESPPVTTHGLTAVANPIPLLVHPTLKIFAVPRALTASRSRNSPFNTTPPMFFSNGLHSLLKTTQTSKVGELRTF
jgi:hypothetical protein